MKNVTWFFKNFGSISLLVSTRQLGKFILFFTLFLSINIVSSQVTIIYDDFESGFGNWNDGGANCTRVNNAAPIQGNWHIRLNNGNGVASAMTTNVLDLSSFGQINIRFRFRITGYENGEQFVFQYSSGGGFADNIGVYRVGTNVNNNITYTANITMSAENFILSTNSRFRIRSLANNNNDRVYVDDISFIGYPIPPNDECAGAISILPNTSCDNTVGSTQGATESLPGCSGTSDDDVWYSFDATNTEHTIRVAGSNRDMAFEVFDGSCGGASLVCENSNNNNLPDETTLTGLTVNNTYFIRVYTVSNNPRFNGDFSICIIEPCTPSVAPGSTDLGCPSVDAGGVGQSGGDITINCSIGNTTLEADYLELGDTSSYLVSTIPYNPPFQFNCLANPVSVNIDDRWSDVINLPFDFCFYGNTYNSCVVGSNGVISFDTSLANTFSGWQIIENIPGNNNTTGRFYGPSIYGVHHDVDPSVGGEIGYQLIDLDTGCQALVAAWSDVPMYADNSILYSGMIVFYEDTNVIEVYIKEKRIDGTWNAGNATVGLQENATNAITAPGRNSLDPNWTATNEAWRFTPNGASITDLRWYENAIAPGNEIIDPDDDGEITVSPIATTTYFAEVTYSLCNGSTIVESDATIVTVEGQKTWNGSVDSDWDNPNNWTPTGIPDATNCITIPSTTDDPVMDGAVDGAGLNLRINSGAVLTQNPNSTLTITEDITIDSGGSYNLEDSASLIQIDNVANTVDGNFTMDRTANIRANDYVYWASPVTSFNIEDVSPGTPNGFKYRWLPFLNRTPGPPGPLNYGEWGSYNSGAMDVGRGYIVRGPNGHPTTPAPFTATFSGAPNNGDIIQAIERSGYTGADYTYQPYPGGDVLLVTSDDDNWNLIGNPYPSAINSVDFLSLPANSNIDGVVYLWTHGTDIGTGNSDPFYEDYAYNYNVADYIAYNASGTSTPSGFSGNIGSGQGFFVLMNDAASPTETVTFNNSMRSSAYANNQFYRTANANVTNEATSRIWLDYITPSGNTNTSLIAYIEGATNGVDRMFDAVNSKGQGLHLYSIINDKAYLIQGRQLPFDDNDTVPLGINITQSGIQTLAINTLEGPLSDPSIEIYIEDLLNGTLHNIKNAPYIFSSDEGIVDDRFVLRYTGLSLGTDDFEVLDSIKVFEENDKLIVKSGFEPIQSIEVFDILGRRLFANPSVNVNRFSINAISPSDTPLFLKIKLTDGKQKIAKIIF